MTSSFESSISDYTSRTTSRLEEALPAADIAPTRLHEAMRYAVLNGGKRMRPLLVYATGECLCVPVEKLDAAAVAIELIHAFSLVHDDLPAMDNDDLRRGQPTVHRKFDEATAILAADALQPLAFEVIARSADLDPGESVQVTTIIAAACGSRGMTGGQSIDLAAEGGGLDGEQLEIMHRLKTGALIEASVLSVASLRGDMTDDQRGALRQFAESIGLAFQIRDDILDVVGNTADIGKQSGADESRGKVTWPSVFGIEESNRRCDELLDFSLSQLAGFGSTAELLRQLARYMVDRHR